MGTLYCKFSQILSKNKSAFKQCYLFLVMPATVIAEAEEPPCPPTKASGNL